MRLQINHNRPADKVAIRAYIALDAESVQNIMASCTSELREIYTPKPQAEIVSANNASPGTRIVAVDHTDTVAGVAECIIRPSELYIQGVAVAPTHRRCGVATSLFDYISKLAIDLGLPTLQLATIKETGNVGVFKRLGFTVVEEQISERFLGNHGQPVIEVTLKRSVTSSSTIPII